MVTEIIENVTTLSPKARKRGLLASWNVTTLFAAVTILAGCQTTTKGSFCAISDPIRPSQATIETMTDAEVTALLAHNSKGEKLCGWRP